MDWVVQKKQLWEMFRKYRSVLLAALIGILFMTLPEKKEDVPVQKSVEIVVEPDLESALADILSKISGAGQVAVLLTQQEGERMIYQCDEVRNEADLRSDTVLVTGGTREESGLIRQILPPVYRGAVVVCQGADNSKVRLSIVEAVKSVTGLTSDRITVLKMK